MSKDRVVEFKTPVEEEDPLTELLRMGSQKLIAGAVEAEFAELLSQYAGRVDGQGRRAVVRNGYLPEREIQTGIGPVKVRVPKARDRSGSGVKFNSRLLPPYLRRTKQIAELLPWLYLKGVSTGDFREALAALLGADARGLSPGTISRLKDHWREDHAQWLGGDLSQKRYVYFWADGVYFNIRGDEARQCILVIVGVDVHGIKEFVAIEDGYRESEQSWLEVLSSCKQRGLEIGPELAVGDGALGFWKALSKVYGKTRHQRCWVHKTANVLNKLPKSLQAKAKRALHEIWMAETKADAALGAFAETYGVKYDKAVECLIKDRQAMLAFYDFPAEHWKHLRTSNPIESTFATVRHRTVRTKGCLSNKTALAMIFKLAQAAEKSWRRLDGHNQLPKLIAGVKFVDGIEAVRQQHQAAA